MHFYLNIIPDKRTYCERCVQPGDGCHLADAFVHTEDNKDGRFAQLHLLWHFLPLQFIQGSLRSRIQPFTILIEVSIKMQLFTCFIQLLWHLEVIVFCIMSCADTAGLPEKHKIHKICFSFCHSTHPLFTPTSTNDKRKNKSQCHTRQKHNWGWQENTVLCQVFAKSSSSVPQKCCKILQN